MTSTRRAWLLVSLAACGESIAPAVSLPPSASIAQVEWHRGEEYCIVFSSGDVGCRTTNELLYDIPDPEGLSAFEFHVDWRDGLPRISQLRLSKAGGFALAWDGSLWRFGYTERPPEEVKWPQVGRIRSLESTIWWTPLSPYTGPEVLVLINEAGDFIVGVPGTDEWTRVGDPGQALAFVRTDGYDQFDGLFIQRDGLILTQLQVRPSQWPSPPPPPIRRPGAVTAYQSIGFVAHLDEQGQLWRDQCGGGLTNVNAQIPDAPRITSIPGRTNIFLTEDNVAWALTLADPCDEARPFRFGAYPSGLVSTNLYCFISDGELRCNDGSMTWPENEWSYEPRGRIPSITAEGQREWP